MKESTPYLISTTATHQVVLIAHGVVDFAYAWSRQAAEKIAESSIHYYEFIIIRESGDFVPHYTYDVDILPIDESREF